MAKIFVGMFRPRWEDITNMKGYIQCSCGLTIQLMPTLREHWQLGHFDTPVYEDS